MDPQGKFLPPQTPEEFKERADKISIDAAVSIIKTLKARRAAVVTALDTEIKFYENVIDHKTKEQNLELF